MSDYTVGVEQEFLLVDPATRRPVSRAEEVHAAARAPEGFDVQFELTPYQIEIATPIAETPEELEHQVRTARRVLVDAAESVGCRLVAAGMPVLGEAGPPPGTDDPRYHRIEYSHRKLIIGQGACGLHVHVGVADRTEAVRASNALRPWLPVLLAMSANSAFAAGEDTGYASWRSMIWSRWPVSGPPPEFSSPEHYDRVVDALVRCGSLIDRAMVYWDVRPSAKHPTVEVRAADIPIEAHEAVVLAELIRAIVVISAPEEWVEDSVLRAAFWRAARDGVDGLLADPITGALTPGFEHVATLIEHCAPVLRDRDQLSTVERHMEWLRHKGCGAARQRRAKDAESLVDMLIAKTREDL
ncbi:putative glutamate--cysteine ligase 2-3 [Lentzea sp. NBRC 105346]|uniref:carboxylate-amine ligase n=1 Tax=Lentzea sp. NBRC 105346 TaxID=3032205 RepID=UPI0024A2CF8C|nr:glutamate--cysteine ligase [Lentzea sp. NBRC 105346]GLZ34608.1 putative glutamate--cysteine ligase 2-3 [Lentzea sp. NBRC 105346]